MRRTAPAEPVTCPRCAVGYRPALTAGTCPVCDALPPGVVAAPASDRDRLLAIVVVATAANAVLLVALAVAVARAA